MTRHSKTYINCFRASIKAKHGKRVVMLVPDEQSKKIYKELILEINKGAWPIGLKILTSNIKVTTKEEALKHGRWALHDEYYKYNQRNQHWEAIPKKTETKSLDEEDLNHPLPNWLYGKDEDDE